jgi:hypothetical protein
MSKLDELIAELAGRPRRGLAARFRRKKSSSAEGKAQ